MCNVGVGGNFIRVSVKDGYIRNIGYKRKVVNKWKSL